MTYALAFLLGLLTGIALGAASYALFAAWFILRPNPEQIPSESRANHDQPTHPIPS